MAAATVSDIWTKATERIGLPLDDGYFTDAVAISFVNKAQQDVAAKADWPELQVEMPVTVGNTAPPYPLNPDDSGGSLIRILWVTYKGRELQPRQRRELLRFDEPGAATGSPSYYAIQGDGTGELVLWVGPHPSQSDTVLTIGMLYKPRALTAMNSTLYLRSHLYDALITKVAYLIAVRKKDSEMAALLLAEHQAVMNELVDEAAPVSGSVIPRVRQDISL